MSPRISAICSFTADRSIAGKMSLKQKTGRGKREDHKIFCIWGLLVFNEADICACE